MNKELFDKGLQARSDVLGEARGQFPEECRPNQSEIEA
jgi:hypothetical protein